ncbi:MAG: hypothetical protein FJW20_16375 [Acidimicrobiia bacterium]|nr:hypothetical protein [Acidimicrobiia bacterium]
MRRTAMLAALQLAANAVLMWGGYYWLGVGESDMWRLAWSATVALSLILFGCWWYGATLAYFAEDGGAIKSALRLALGHLPALIFVAAVAAALYDLVSMAMSYSGAFALKVASELTYRLQKPVSPQSVQNVLDTISLAIRWGVIPALLIPVAAAVAARGWSGFRAFGLPARRLYWLLAPLLLVCALEIPRRLLRWIPEVDGFWVEMLSFLLRAGAGYLLLAAGWLALAFVTSAGKPRLSQPSTVSSP